MFGWLGLLLIVGLHGFFVVSLCGRRDLCWFLGFCCALYVRIALCVVLDLIVIARYFDVNV